MGIGDLLKQEFEASEASLQRLDWICPRCGHKALVEVLGSASVVEQHGALADGVKAKAGVEARASTAAKEDVARCIALAQCPKCNTRDRGFVWRTAALEAFPLPFALCILGVLFGAVGAWNGDVSIGLAGLSAFVGLGTVFLAISTPVQRGRLLKRADLAVDFVLDA